MPVPNSVYSYGLMIAGSVFIAIGIYSVIYSNTSVKVDLDGVINPGSQDILSPNMEIGRNTLLELSGSLFNVSLTFPNKTSFLLINNASDFEYDIEAKQNGEHIIKIFNFGNSEVLIDGYAYTKGNEIALVGQLMLLATGIVILWMGIRIRRRN
ncbi:MAG TPA: hypothetical protein VK250_04980 [Nitrososphaeraceae archaeon]|nr:hypothetical protein [Nitrososphaeraceae archaeon]